MDRVTALEDSSEHKIFQSRFQIRDFINSPSGNGIVE
jgi:hypothetical protein